MLRVTSLIGRPRRAVYGASGLSQGSGTEVTELRLVGLGCQFQHLAGLGSYG